MNAREVWVEAFLTGLMIGMGCGFWILCWLQDRARQPKTGRGAWRWPLVRAKREAALPEVW